MKPNLTFLFIIIGLILFISNAASAGNTYNFYFAPDEEGVIKGDNGVSTPTAAVTPEVTAAPEVKKRDPHRFRGFRLGVAFSVTGIQGVFDPEAAVSEEAYMPGVTFAVRLFPAKYFGLFGEATIGGESNWSFEGLSSRSGFTRLSYNFGAEIVPIRIDFFGIDDILELAAEVGFSTRYFSYYKGGDTGNSGTYGYQSFDVMDYREFAPSIFYGPKLRMNMGPAFSLETMLRIGSQDEQRHMQFLAGATVNF